MTSDAELDRMYEIAVAQDWEEQNKTADAETLKRAARSIGWAIDELENTADFINEAADILIDTPEGDRIKSFLYDVKNALTDLRKLKKQWKGEA